MQPTTVMRPKKHVILLKMAGYAYLFFLALEMMGEGMKASFKESLKAYLATHAADFSELASFVIGVLGTSLVQSSSTVTSLTVKLTQEGVIPLLIAIGIVHGANLGTSVTSSLVAFAAETRPGTGNLLKDGWNLLFAKRRPGFHRAVSTAVVHGLFNVILVTTLLISLELPFGLIRIVSSESAEAIGAAAAQGSVLLTVLQWTSPATYTRPVAAAMLDFGAPGWLLVVGSFGLLFASIRGFAFGMGRSVVGGDGEDVAAIGRRMLGTHPLDTFARGLFLTIIVQSSSATTSMVVPLAAMGLFSLRQVLPFILGANIGTTTTAIIAAGAAIGQPGFESGMTIALSHFYLNTFAVVLVVLLPPLRTSVLGAAEWLADAAERVPAALLAYLATLVVVFPAVVYFLPTNAAWALLAATVVVLIVAPHLYLRRKSRRVDAPDDGAIVAA